MNILILFTQPWRIGGAETHIEAMLKGLSEHKIFLAVNIGSDEIKLSRLEKNFSNLKIVKIQSRGINIFAWKSSLRHLKNLIINEKIDIISAQQRTAGIWAWRLSKATKIKYTVTMHDPWHRAKFKHFYPKIFPQMLVVSKNLANVLYEQYGFSKESVHIVNNGVDFLQFKLIDKNISRQELNINLPIKNKMILHVSRMSNVKGAVSMVIIDALEYLASKQIFYKLVIIGEGPYRKKIEERAEAFNKKYGDWITIKNFVSDINLWYNATDILIGEGRVAIEALACEKPVIAIRNSKSFIGLITNKNIAYACEVNFDGKDKPATGKYMAEEIERAFKLSEENSKSISQYVKQNLSIINMVEVYLNIFKKELADSAR